MAKITEIRPCSRPVRVKNRSVMEFNRDARYFSLWVRAAGAEAGVDDYPLSIQLDKAMARRLRDCLNEFLAEESLGNH